MVAFRKISLRNIHKILTIPERNMKRLMIAVLAALCSLGFAKTWTMAETTGQKLADRGNGPANPGYLGIAPAPDELDAKLTGAEGIICNGKTTFTIPSGPFFSFEKARDFTMSIDVKFLEELDAVDAGWTRCQIVTKGYDSQKGSWQLRLVRRKAFGPYHLEFFMKTHEAGNKWFSCNAPVTLLPQKWYKFAVTMDRQQCRLYMDGKVIASTPCRELPPSSTAPILMGIYANGKTLGFPMQIRNFTVEKDVVKPHTASK